MCIGTLKGVAAQCVEDKPAGQSQRVYHRGLAAATRPSARQCRHPYRQAVTILPSILQTCSGPVHAHGGITFRLRSRDEPDVTASSHSLDLSDN
jgi:hypothetical protein